MKTIIEISNHLKGFGDHIFQEGMLQDGYKDLFVLLALAGITSIFLHLIERRS